MSPRAACRLESLGFMDVYDYTAGKLDWLASGLPTEGTNVRRPRASAIARADVPTCRLDDRLGDVAERTHAAGWDACVVVSEERCVLGLLRAAELAKDPAQRIEAAMRPGPSTFRPHVPVAEMARFMREHGLESTPITRADGTLMGLLLRDDVERMVDEPDHG